MQQPGVPPGFMPSGGAGMAGYNQQSNASAYGRPGMVNSSGTGVLGSVLNAYRETGGQTSVQGAYGAPTNPLAATFFSSGPSNANGCVVEMIPLIITYY